MEKSDQKLFWPPEPSGLDIVGGWSWIILGVFTIWTVILPLIFFPLGYTLIKKGKQKAQEVEDKRQEAIRATSSILMTKATYVGGHPLISNEGEMVINLSNNAFGIFAIDSRFAIQLLDSIPIGEIENLAMGRPKSAKEVYDEDHGTTIDVYEQSPFLRISFNLDDHIYTVSFQSLKNQTPNQWRNQIVALQYQLRSSVIDQVDNE